MTEAEEWIERLRKVHVKESVPEGYVGSLNAAQQKVRRLKGKIEPHRLWTR